MRITQALQNLGFSPQDSQIYISLLKVGESSVGAIIADTGLHRDIVYGALTRLDQQGLVQSIEKKKIRHYQALDPAVLVRKVQEKADLAKSILPELKQLFTQPEVTVRVYEGVDGLEETEKDWAATLKDGEALLCIGGAGKSWYDLGKQFNHEKYHKKLFERGIRFKTVTYTNEAREIRENETAEFNPVRVLPESYKVPSSTIIYGDKIQIQIFGERFFAIVIQSKAVSDSYRRYFDILWNMGKPLKATKSKK
jgi:sugar-specific transcriptional regulator TrmB